MVASTMLKGGLSNRTLQYAEVSSMTRTCDVDSVMIHALAPSRARCSRNEIKRLVHGHRPLVVLESSSLLLSSLACTCTSLICSCASTSLLCDARCASTSLICSCAFTSPLLCDDCCNSVVCALQLIIIFSLLFSICHNNVAFPVSLYRVSL